MATPWQVICQNTHLCMNRSSAQGWTKCLSWCAGYSSEQWERKASPESSREENGCRKILVLCLQNTLPLGNTVTGRHKLQRTVTSEKCLDIFLFSIFYVILFSYFFFQTSYLEELPTPAKNISVKAQDALQTWEKCLLSRIAEGTALFHKRYNSSCLFFDWSKMFFPLRSLLWFTSQFQPVQLPWDSKIL